MMTPEEMQKALEDRRLPVVSRETGIHYNTLKNIRDGDNKNPSYRVARLLSDYLERRP